MALAGAGCGGAPAPAPPVAPLAQARAAADAARVRVPRGPGRVVFSWRAREPDFRGSGSGVARVEPPDKARLDLFLDNGETAFAAALVGDDLRVPARALPASLVPPPALLWAALGIFRPGRRARLVEGRVAGGTGTLLYDDPESPGARTLFRLRDHSIVEAAVLEGAAAVERVVVEARSDGEPYPARAAYRSLRDFRELILELRSHDDADAFPPEIWRPVGP